MSIWKSLPATYKLQSDLLLLARGSDAIVLREGGVYVASGRLAKMTEGVVVLAAGGT